MVQIKSLHFLFALMTLVVLGSQVAEAVDYLSGVFSGPCWAWSGEQCRRICREDGALSGHCSPGLQCWCEGK